MWVGFSPTSIKGLQKVFRTLHSLYTALENIS